MAPVIVVGGGLAGVATLYELARLGVRCDLLDASADLATGASFANGGLLTASMSDPWNAPGALGVLAKSPFNPYAALKLRPHAIPSQGTNPAATRRRRPRRAARGCRRTAGVRRVPEGLGQPQASPPQGQKNLGRPRLRPVGLRHRDDREGDPISATTLQRRVPVPDRRLKTGHANCRRPVIGTVVAQMEIIKGEPRRRWTAEEKLEIVAETLATGKVTEVARRHGANPSMVFAWRKKLMGPIAPTAIAPTLHRWMRRPCRSRSGTTGRSDRNLHTDVLSRIAEHPALRLAELLPWTWNAAREPAEHAA